MTFYDIFVYGTLRRGGMYAHYLADSELIKEKYYLSGYALYDYQQWYPYMIAQTGSSVIGDIYQVAEVALPAVHELEGVDEQLYRFIYLAEHQFYTYLKFDTDVAGLPYVESGDWLAYYQSLNL
ncbi:gamma-glutamylcyclotransferase family protein [Tunicatimonas pelagia]|uniref:gamma-glutamylcyclotransferase family protein n=1 Tax=Tunicatimonas pelagia TaxID=931531 RepID=UPI002665800D|nr:gamma-glutamylcyclotransferase family protein [Tunicatimonas pelagia]WKN42629.1 gamma-glutamylcyclotransferase [Tunicatimonas pelagia]